MICCMGVVMMTVMVAWAALARVVSPWRGRRRGAQIEVQGGAQAWRLNSKEPRT